MMQITFGCFHMAHSIEEKINAVAEYKQHTSIVAICKKYGVCKRTIYRWKEEFGKSESNQSTISLKEYKSLQRRIEKLENIVSILKAVNCTTHSPLTEKLSELEKLYGQYDVHTLCEALDVSRGTFYNHIFRSKRNDVWFMKRREEYRKIIQDTFDEYNQILGSEKLQAVPVRQGYQVSTKFETFLMAEWGYTVL